MNIRLKILIWATTAAILAVFPMSDLFGQAQRPPEKAAQEAQTAATQTTKPNAAAAQNAAQNTVPDVVRVARKNLPQDPLRIAVHNAIQKGIQEAELNPAAIQAMQTAQNALQNVAPNGAPNIESNPSTQQNTSPNAVQTGSRNPNLSSNGPAAVKTAPNPGQPAAAPTGPIPPAINAGIEATVSSRASLENAGNKWGGHKEKAIKLIDDALQACGQTTAPDNAGTKSSPAEETAAMQAALTQLTAAQKHFMSAKDPWGGRRDQVLALINQALAEVQSSIDFAKSHNGKN